MANSQVNEDSPNFEQYETKINDVDDNKVTKKKSFKEAKPVAQEKEIIKEKVKQPEKDESSINESVNLDELENIKVFSSFFNLLYSTFRNN